MKQKIFFIMLFVAMLLPKAGFSQLTAADQGGCLLSGDVWSPNGSVAGHTTYQTLLSCCGVPCRVQWSVANNRWEVIAAVDSDGVFNDVLNYNTTNTSPNPPALGNGNWTDSGFGCGSLTQFSGPYTTSANPAPVITGNPPNRTICVGANTTFTVSATGATSYQWQVNTGGGFTNISNGAPYSGATTTTLTITNATASMNGYTYRAVATGSGSATSSSGTLTISNIVTTGSKSDILCNGGNGTATVIASGGISPYSYSWAPSGGTAATASGLSAGTYTVTVTDNIGCEATRSFTITEPTQLVASPAAQTNIACNGGATGSAMVNVSGGTPGYTYSWSP
ncbi:SprB repeat-containing protein, partial [Flavobacterium soli]|uniref:SprB repeat-containing protein n=1 Tax=Flavobacterium soli TaxID=344881 RepID=UPI001B7F7F5B